MANKINVIVKTSATVNSIFARMKQSGSPRIDPNVPGATDKFPIKQPVAMNMTDFCLKFMNRLYILASFLSSNRIRQAN